MKCGLKSVKVVPAARVNLSSCLIFIDLLVKRTNKTRVKKIMVVILVPINSPKTIPAIYGQYIVRDWMALIK